MGYHLHEIGILIRNGHLEEARERIVEVFRKAGAVRQYAADELGVDQATLWRWVKKLGLEATLERADAAAVEGGTKVERRGRPVGAKDSKPRTRSPNRPNVVGESGPTDSEGSEHASPRADTPVQLTLPVLSGSANGAGDVDPNGGGRGRRKQRQLG